MNVQQFLCRSKEEDKLMKLSGEEYFGSSCPIIIKKVPTARQVKRYFLNIFKTNAYLVENESGKNKMYEMSKEIWSKHFKNIPFSKHKFLIDRFYKVLYSYDVKEIEKLLCKYNLMPKYFYGLRKNEKSYFFDFMLTGISYASFEDDIFIFEMFNTTEHRSVFNSTYFEGVYLPQKICYTNDGKLFFYLPYKNKYVLLTKDFSIFEIEEIFDSIEEASHLTLIGLNDFKRSDIFNVDLIDKFTPTFDDQVIPTIIEMGVCPKN